MNTVIEFETKSHYGGPDLVYIVSEHQKALQELTGTRTLTKKHIEALKALGFEFKQKQKESILGSLSDCIKECSHKLSTTTG